LILLATLHSGAIDGTHAVFVQQCSLCCVGSSCAGQTHSWSNDAQQKLPHGEGSSAASPASPPKLTTTDIHIAPRVLNASANGALTLICCQGTMPDGETQQQQQQQQQQQASCESHAALTSEHTSETKKCIELMTKRCSELQ
jgi:hypothetical protein